MRLRRFFQMGHWPTLLAALVYFFVCFMIWGLLGALANLIVARLNLSAGEKGLLVATPVLGGALLRVPLGILTDRLGAKRVGLWTLLLTGAPLLLGWLWAESFVGLLLVGLLLGVAGASFAVALPLAGRWYPQEYQGLALGIVGVGNCGTAFTTLLAPRLGDGGAWHGVFALALLPLVPTLLLFWLMACDSPRQPPPRPLASYAQVLRQRDAWWFCLFYAVTFGGFVGLASYLNLLFHDEYGLEPVHAANLVTACVLVGSLLRPLGGYLADRFGGVRLLAFLYGGIGLTMLAMTFLPPLVYAVPSLMLGMAFLGMGNGAVFQLVPQRFPESIGVLTGIVGAAGGVGGFLLPSLLGGLKQSSGSAGGGFLLFALASGSCLAALLYVSASWARDGLRAPALVRT
jgi:NNP family nitrate/nitrite transporter-like MFS transporter